MTFADLRLIAAAAVETRAAFEARFQHGGDLESFEGEQRANLIGPPIAWAEYVLSLPEVPVSAAALTAARAHALICGGDSARAVGLAYLSAADEAEGA